MIPCMMAMLMCIEVRGLYQHVQGWCQRKRRNLLFIYTDRSQGSSCSHALQPQLESPPNSCSNLRILLSYLQVKCSAHPQTSCYQHPPGGNYVIIRLSLLARVMDALHMNSSLCTDILWHASVFFFNLGIVFFSSSCPVWRSDEAMIAGVLSHPSGLGPALQWPKWAGPNSRGFLLRRFEIVKLCLHGYGKMPSAVQETESKSEFLPDNETCHVRHSVNNVVGEMLPSCICTSVSED